MGKRTPVEVGSRSCVYVFLSNPGVVIKISGVAYSREWYNKNLRLNFNNCKFSFAPYSGSRNMAYFKSAKRNHELSSFEFFVSESNTTGTCCMYINGVDKLHTPENIESFDNNMSTLSVLRHFRIPPPESVRIYWSMVNESRQYTCTLNCAENRRTRTNKQSVMDELLSDLL